MSMNQMENAKCHIWKRTLLIANLLAFLGTFLSAFCASGDEGRAAWFHRFEWSTRQDVEDEIANIDNCNMNAVVFQIRGTADAFYISEHEPWSHYLGNDYPGYDPLAVAIYEAHKRGLELHAYVNVMPAWSGSTPPSSPNHIYNAHPEWIMVDTAGIPMDPAAGYANVSPGIPQVQQHINRVIMDIATNYDVDGIHLDYIRYPHLDYSHDDSSLARFDRDYPGCTPSTCPNEWKAFRRTLVTEVVEATHDSVTALKPWVKISAAVWGVFYYGYNDYFQDSHGWLEAGIMDFTAPMIYTSDTEAFGERLYNHMVNSYGRHVYGGIGIYLGFSTSTMVAEIETCRVQGAQGEVMFSATDLYGGYKSTLLSGPYASYDSIPDMPWKGSQPFIASVAITPDGDHVDVLFNRDVDPTTGENPANYTFQGGLAATDGARDASDHRLIHLTTTPQHPESLYTLTVSNVQDEGGKETVAWPNNRRKFYGLVGSGIEIIVDDEDGAPVFTTVGSWPTSTYGDNWNTLKHYHSPGSGLETATWTTPITTPGNYAVSFWVNDGGYAEDAHYYIDTYAGLDSAIGDQGFVGTPEVWQYLGTFPFLDTARVTVTDTFTVGTYVVADAIKWTFVSPLPADAPPAAIADLRTDKSNSDIVLSWSPVTTDTLGNPETISQYVVYRETQPNTPPADSIGATSDTTFTDPGAAGSVATNYYYVVRAVDDDQSKSSSSNKAGEFDIDLSADKKAMHSGNTRDRR
jgi:uncharacterized lipoprotein YddW (UPF0748 family)